MYAKTKSILAVAGLFFALFLYFLLGKGWYVPSRLEIRGIAPEMQAELEVAWDGGAGWNAYERRTFPIETVAAEENGEPHSIIIRNTGDRHGGSLSATVTCSRIRIDGEALDLSAHAGRGTFEAGQINLSNPNDLIRLDIHAKEHIQITLLTNNHSGKAEISVNGRSRVHDLYIANVEAREKTFDYWVIQPDGTFAVDMEMPRYGLKSLRIANNHTELPILIKSATISDEDQRVSLQPATDSPLKERNYSGFSKPFKKFVDPAQMAIQALFAALTTWILLAIRCLVRKCGGIQDTLFGQARYVFWGFFLFAVSGYAIWLAAFWPGIMSVDSLKVWRAASLPEVMINDHPFFFVLLYTYLQHIWNHVAVVPVFHILLMALFAAWLFFRMYRDGITLLILLPLFAMAVFSMPIGLYNLVLWKDIPFALLVAFWGVTLADLYRKRREGTLVVTGQGVVALFLLYLAIGLIRHNGLVFLVMIPVFLIVLRIIPFKPVAAAAAVVTVLAALLFIGFQSRLPVKDSGFFLNKTSELFQKATSVSLDQEILRTGREYWGVLDINQTRSKWDLWHYYLNDRQAYWFLKHSGWWDVYPYIPEGQTPNQKLRDLAMKVYWKSYQRPWVFLSWNPVPLLALFPAVLLFCRWLRASAIFSAFVLIQVIALLGVINILNWRYYYFFYMAGIFLPVMLAWDLKGLTIPSRTTGKVG